MSYDDDDFFRALGKALEEAGVITPEMAKKQEDARRRNHERLVRLGLVRD